MQLDEWQKEAIHAVIMSVAEAFELKIGKIGQPLRVAVTGTGISPSIDVTLALIGKDKTLKRMDKALDFIKKRDAS